MSYCMKCGHTTVNGTCSRGLDCAGYVLGPEEGVTYSGAVRLNSGKPQLDEVDPQFILGIAEIMTASKAKYATGNWMKSTKLSVPFDSLMRHLLAFQSGEDIDKESGKSHLFHAATNLMILSYHLTNHPENDDRLFKGKKK